MTPTKPISHLNYPCTRCPRTFTRKFHLQRHQLSHSPNRPFTCPLCLSSFNRRDVLNRHVEAHARRERQDEESRHHQRQHSIQHRDTGSSKSTADASSAPAAPLPARARTFAACDACTLQKIKCDDGAPCQACERAGIECTFERPQRVKGRYRPVVSAPNFADRQVSIEDGILYQMSERPRAR